MKLKSVEDGYLLKTFMKVAVAEQNKILNDMDRCLSLQGLY